MNISVSLAVKVIDYYQVNLSHKKKYRCAYGALNNDATCSSYGKERIIKRGFFLGSFDIIQRLYKCWKASKEIKEKNISASFANQSSQNKQNPKDESIDFCTKSYLVVDAACCIATLIPW